MKIYYTEISIKPLPLGSGQLLCNCPEISVSEQQNSSEIRNFEAPKIFDFLGTPNKPPISRMLENCILDDLQEIKFLEALVCGKTQEVSDFQKFQLQEINLKIKIK